MKQLAARAHSLEMQRNAASAIAHRYAAFVLSVLQAVTVVAPAASQCARHCSRLPLALSPLPT